MADQPTAEEYALFREAYAETYPVRPLLNAIDAKDAEIERLRAALEKIARDEKAAHQAWVSRSEETARDALRGADETNIGRDAETREGSVRQARDTPCDVTISTSETAGPQLCTCRDGARYRFIRQGEDELSTKHEAAFAAMWAEIALKGLWRERMDKRIDDAMQQLDGEVAR